MGVRSLGEGARASFSVSNPGAGEAMETLERAGAEALQDLERYLWRHYQENIALLSDLRRESRGDRGRHDAPALHGYRLQDRIVAVQGIYRSGRWLPHFEREDVLPAMLEDARNYWLRWVMGARHVVDPILEHLPELGLRVSFDEIDAFCFVDHPSLIPRPAPGVRRATRRDVEGVAVLRCAFEAEYFRVAVERIERSWCLRAAERYIRDGAYVAERGGQVVSFIDYGSEVLLVKPDVARRQLDTETAKPADGAGAVEGAGGGGEGVPGGVTEGGSRTPGAQPEPAPPKRFHGTVSLDPRRVGLSASKVAEEVIAHLSGLVGAKVTVTLDIEAEIPGGAPEHVVRTVTENSRTLKFTSQGFEVE